MWMPTLYSWQERRETLDKALSDKNKNGIRERREHCMIPCGLLKPVGLEPLFKLLKVLYSTGFWVRGYTRYFLFFVLSYLPYILSGVYGTVIFIFNEDAVNIAGNDNSIFLALIQKLFVANVIIPFFQFGIKAIQCFR